MIELRPLPRVTHLNALPIYEACDRLFERPTIAAPRTVEDGTNWYIVTIGMMRVLSKLDAKRPEYFIEMDNGRRFGLCVSGPYAHWYAHWMQSDVLVRPTEEEYAELRLCL